MFSIVTGILSSTVGLLANKVRDSAAAKLKDGGVTDAKIREFVVRELNDIKTKLDALSLKELKYSYVGLKEGVNFIYFYLYNSNELDQEAATDPTQEDRVEVSRMQGGVESHFLNKALELSDAMETMKSKSAEEFKTAKRRFEVAREKASEAFCNDVLSINEKIFAAKVRVVSEILEHLESPQIAITGCFSFLEDLHKLPTIRDIFSAYLKGTSKPLFSKDERVEAVKSVMLINYVLYRFNLKFSSRKLTADRFIWPATIELNDGRNFNPILDWREVATRKSMGDELSKLDDHWELTRSLVCGKRNFGS
jgi:hypothetical protein